MMNKPIAQADNARLIAERLHAGQVDKAGKPYIGHLARVAAAVESDLLKAVAWLHDSIEDCGIGAHDLQQQGVAQEVVEGVLAMSKVEGEPYDEYLERVKANPLARRVKLADLADNMDPSRLPNPSAKDQRRMLKYQQAAAYLSAA
jgi:(p)ppGpp synthase/HD superfamily hydrolase